MNLEPYFVQLFFLFTSTLTSVFNKICRNSSMEEKPKPMERTERNSVSIIRMGPHIDRIGIDKET